MQSLRCRNFVCFSRLFSRWKSFGNFSIYSYEKSRCADDFMVDDERPLRLVFDGVDYLHWNSPVITGLSASAVGIRNQFFSVKTRSRPQKKATLASPVTSRFHFHFLLSTFSGRVFSERQKIRTGRVARNWNRLFCSKHRVALHNSISFGEP